MIKWAKGKGIKSQRFLSSWVSLQFLKFPCTLKNQLSNSFPTSAQYFLRMNTDSWINWTILILLPLNTRINYEQLFQDLQMKYVSKFVGRNLSARKNAHKHSTFIKVTVMQIENRLRVSKISWKFRIPTIYNFAVIYPWNLQFS